MTPTDNPTISPLTTEELAFFKQFGYLIKPKVLNAATCNELVDLMWQSAPGALDRFDPRTYQTIPKSEWSSDSLRFVQDDKWQFRALGTDQPLIDAMTHPQLWQWGEQLLGKGNLRAPTPGGQPMGSRGPAWPGGPVDPQDTEGVRGIYATLPNPSLEGAQDSLHTDGHPFHVGATYDKLTLTDKAAHTYCLGSERVEDTMEMVRIAGGLSHEEFEAKPHMYTNINSTSPLKHDWPMIDGCLRLARRGQAIFVTPFTLAGAMAPVTMAGAVTQSIAEALCAIALFQYVRPGIPCVIGTFTSNVDMKTGAPAFGTAEYMRATQMTGQMGRFYKLPIRSSGVCAANVPDGQAMWETSNSLWAAVQSGSNVVYHAAGWLEGGLIASPEKFIMDCEVLQLIQRYFEPIITRTEPEDIAIEAIKEVGSSGHFFGVQHTQDRYETAFHQPFISDWRNYEGWELAGGIWTAERASAKYKEIIADYKKPPMDEAIHEELRAFVDRRVSEGGAPTDF